MRKAIIVTLSLSLISSFSSTVISCGMPNGSEITLNWIDGNNTTAVNDNLLAGEAINPLFNYLNSTEESRGEAKLPNDGMTQDQISNTLEKQETTLEANSNSEYANNWTQFYKLWSSNEDFSYKNIDVYTGKSTAQIPTYDSTNKKVSSDNIDVPEDIKTVIDYLNTNYSKSDDYSKNNSVYSNIDNSNSNKADLTFNFDNQFSFQVQLTSLIAKLSLESLSDGTYQWFLSGYNYVDADHYPITANYSGCDIPFMFTPDVGYGNDGTYNYPHLDYSILPDSIKKIN